MELANRLWLLSLPPVLSARHRNGIRFDSSRPGIQQAVRGASLETGLCYRHINSSQRTPEHSLCFVPSAAVMYTYLNGRQAAVWVFRRGRETCLISLSSPHPPHLC